MGLPALFTPRLAPIESDGGDDFPAPPGDVVADRGKLTTLLLGLNARRRAQDAWREWTDEDRASELDALKALM